MNKKDIISVLKEQTALPLSICDKCYDAFVYAITDGLKKGEEVVVSGLGKFVVKQRKARKVINPQTKKMINVPAKLLPQFKAGKRLKDSIV